MSYIGRQRPTETTSSVLRSTYTGDGSTTTFNLPGPVANEISIIATINGVTQQDSAYTTNGSQIIFASAPANGDAIELRTISDVGLSYAPFAGSVTTGILADDAVTAAKLASGAAVANIGTRAIGVSQVPAGSVIQVVQTTRTESNSLSIASNFTAISGVSASITPSASTSQILVLVRGHIYQDTNDTTGGVTIYRNGVNVSNGTYGLSAFYGYFGTSPGNIDFVYPVDIKYVDSPATTSSVTYALYYKSDQAVGWNTVRGSETSIILMEIAR